MGLVSSVERAGSPFYSKKAGCHAGAAPGSCMFSPQAQRHAGDFVTCMAPLFLYALKDYRYKSNTRPVAGSCTCRTCSTFTAAGAIGVTGNTSPSLGKRFAELPG